MATYGFRSSDGHIFRGLTFDQLQQLIKQDQMQKQTAQETSDVSTAQRQLDASAQQQRLYAQESARAQQVNPKDLALEQSRLVGQQMRGAAENVVATGDTGVASQEDTRQQAEAAIRQRQEADLQKRMNSPSSRAWLDDAARAQKTVKELGIKYPESKRVQALQEQVQQDTFNEGIGQFADKLGSGGYRDEAGKVNADQMRSDALNMFANSGMSKQALSQMEEILKQEASSGSGGAGKTQLALRMALNTPENQKAASELLDQLEESGSIDPSYAKSQRALLATDAYGVLRSLDDYTGKVGSQVQTFDQLAPRRVNLAGQTKTVQNLAPERLPNKQSDELMSAQNIFANLQDANAKFNNKYATAYGGKAIKLAVLRRNDPEFASFTSSLGLAMNEYRRQNFGTAQTNSEIQNFLDVLNTDTEIRPEAFRKQLETVSKAMQRDYNNKVKNYQENRYVVPKSMSDINIQGSSQTPSGGAIKFTRDPKTGKLVRQ